MSLNLDQYSTEEGFENLDNDEVAHQHKEERPVKRVTRTRNKPKRYDDFLETTTSRRNNEVNVSDSDDDDDNIEAGCSQKPTALFGQDDVGGQDIFRFKYRRTKHDLQNKVRSAVSNSPSVAESLKTPKKNPTLKLTEATPRHVTSVMKKRIIREIESDSAESDFSGSSSDFVPDKSDDESESSSSGSNIEEEDESEELPKNVTKTRIVMSKSNKIKPKESEYYVTPDNYFAMNSSKKITTSDHTLARVFKNMNLSDVVNDADSYISTEHQSKICNLVQSYEQLFNKWLFILSEGFNIILYGVGSKRSVINQFQMQKLTDMPCVVINGFFPSLNIKNVLETIVIDLLEKNKVPQNIGDVASLIESQLSETNTHLFLLIHSIDGPMLRNAKAQSVLANLSQLEHVHTIATIDHINAPLLWDHSKLSKFKFTWWDATTFLPYTEETSYENSLMTQRSGALQLSSLKSVYQSLTTNAKGIFNIIIQYQLENQNQAHYQGLPYKDLYLKAREQFLVSSDLALRAQLTEFLDHKLAKIKRSCDGSENLVIPIESALLQQFLEENNSQ